MALAGSSTARRGGRLNFATDYSGCSNRGRREHGKCQYSRTPSHLDQDTDAWLRRLLVWSLKTRDHEQHFGKMAEMILKTESSVILDWLLEGRAKLVKDKLQWTQTPEQKGRTTNLLLGSDSPAAFVRSRLVKKKDADLGVVDLCEHYQQWCRLNHVRPFGSRPFTATAKEEIVMGTRVEETVYL